MFKGSKYLQHELGKGLAIDNLHGVTQIVYYHHATSKDLYWIVNKNMGCYQEKKI